MMISKIIYFNLFYTAVVSRKNYFILLLYKYIIKIKIPVAIWAAVRAVWALASWSLCGPSWSLCALSSLLSLLLLTFLAMWWGRLVGFRAGGGGGGDSGGGWA